MRLRRGKAKEPSPKDIDEPSKTPKVPIPLKKVIEKVSADLRAAQNNEGILELRDCKIELGVSIEADAGGNVQVHVFSVGAHVSTTAYTKVTLRFAAVTDPVTGFKPHYLIAASAGNPSRWEPFPTIWENSESLIGSVDNDASDSGDQDNPG